MAIRTPNTKIIEYTIQETGLQLTHSVNYDSSDLKLQKEIISIKVKEH